VVGKIYILFSRDRKSDARAKIRNPIKIRHSFWRKPESSYFKKFWTPAFAGVTIQETF